jgi:carotenoid cleavage dioxygenase-like enzyme
MHAEQAAPRTVLLVVATALLLLVGTAPPLVAGFSAKAPQKRQKGFSFLHQADRFLTKLQNPSEQLKDHTYLTGNYAPASEEHVSVPVRVVEGALPPGLNGMVSRNGPNPVTNRPLKKRYHWFDGHGMLHNLRIQNGEALYTNQYIPSDRYQVEEEMGEEFFPTLGEYQGILGLMKILFHPAMVREKIPDLKTVLPPNTSVLMYQNKFYCLHEGNLPFECRILPDGRLEPVGYETFDGVLDFPISAHPRIDANGDLLFHSYTSNVDIIEEQGTMKVGRYSRQNKRVESYFVPTKEKYVSFAHNMVFTENYMIVWDCSVHFDPAALFDGGSYFRTKPEYNLRFGIIPKTATTREETIWIDTGKPGGIIHPINSWEEDDGTIVIWTPLCETLDLDLDTDDLNMFSMEEFRINPKTKTLTQEKVDDTMNVEFSVVPEMGRFTRYGYTAIQDPSTPGEGSFTGFCVWDMMDRSYRAVFYDEDEVGGEPVLLRSGDDSDDKKDNNRVYVGIYTYHMKTEQTYFLLYDGETTDLVARLEMPHRVPFGFHGQWISSSELEGHFAHHGFAA